MLQITRRHWLGDQVAPQALIGELEWAHEDALLDDAARDARFDAALRGKVTAAQAQRIAAALAPLSA